MSKDIYATFIGAKGVAFAWIGAAIGPIFFYIGLSPDYHAHLAVGVIAIMIVLFSIVSGLKALKSSSWSSFIASAVIPFVLLVAGTFYAWQSVAETN